MEAVPDRYTSMLLDDDISPGRGRHSALTRSNNTTGGGYSGAHKTFVVTRQLTVFYRLECFISINNTCDGVRRRGWMRTGV